MKITIPKYMHLVLCLTFLLSPASLFANDNKSNSITAKNQILALSDEMKSMVDLFVKPVRNKTLRARALADLMYGKNKMAIKYDSLANKTAQETVESGIGNCLSLANAFIAMARYAGLDAYYISVSLPPNWYEENETYYLAKHTTAQIKLSRRKTMSVEFAWIGTIKSNHAKAINDQRAYAEFYSNEGIKHLGNGDLQAAAENLEYALKTDPSYQAAWSNLGVVYKRQGKLSKAENAYKSALKINSRDLTTLSNLTALYQHMGEQKLVSKYKKRLERYRLKNPYHLIKLAENAIAEKNYKLAIKLAKKAIRKQDDEHRFYFALAKAYAYLGDRKKVEKYLVQSEQYALSGEDISRYRKKLNHIKNFKNGTALLPDLFQSI